MVSSNFCLNIYTLEPYPLCTHAWFVRNLLICQKIKLPATCMGAVCMLAVQLKVEIWAWSVWSLYYIPCFACHMLEQLEVRWGRQEASIADYRGPWIPLFCLVISCTKVCLIRHRTGDALAVYNLLNTMRASCAICLYPASCYSNAKSPTFIIKFDCYIFNKKYKILITTTVFLFSRISDNNSVSLIWHFLMYSYVYTL